MFFLPSSHDPSPQVDDNPAAALRNEVEDLIKPMPQ